MADLDLWNVFKTNKKYFDLITEWHREHQGCAMEDKIKEIIYKNACGNVLDAGCGEGTITKYFSNQISKTIFYGIDISPIGIEIAKQNAPSNCNFCVGELENLPFCNDFFDLIYAHSVLEHVMGLNEVLEEFYRCLKINGKLVVRVGNGGTRNKRFISSFINYIFKNNKIEYLHPTCELRKGHEVENHMSNFDSQEIPSDILLKRLKMLGYKIIYFSTVENYKNMKPQSVKEYIIKYLLQLPVFPFTHLGPTIFLVALK